MPVTEARAKVRRPTAIAIAVVVVEQQRWHGGAARAQAIAARRARERVDGVTRFAQPLDVAADGPVRDLEPVGELRARPVAVCLGRERSGKFVRGRLPSRWDAFPAQTDAVVATAVWAGSTLRP